MKLIIDKNRKVYSAGTWGTKNENNYEILDFEFPEELEEYNKRIVYYLGNQKVWDPIIDNKAILTNAITTKGSVKAYIWCTKSDEAFETDVDFRTQIFVMNFFENDNADGIVPTPEQVDGFNTMLTAMNAKIDEVDALETTIGAAESTRQTNETTRQTNEQTRQTNEATRQSNEQTRQEQEAERERRTDEAIADIEDKTAEYNANAEAKTTAFNNNATQKTNDFNNNYTQKVNDFNTNASSKTSDFNSNAEGKTNTFNSNANSKTTDFNTNAENKTSAFNTNANDKTSAFNDNATQKTTNFDNNAAEKTDEFNNNAQEKIDEYDEHIVEYQAQIDELQEEVDELSENMPWNTTEQATEISVDDAAKYSKNKLELFGNTEQASYDGKNLILNNLTNQTINGIAFVVNSDGSVTINGTASATTQINLLTNTIGEADEITLPAGTYTLQGCPTGGSSSTYKFDITNNGAAVITDYGNNVYSRTFTDSWAFDRVRIVIQNGTTVNNLTFKPMLVEGNTNVPYEPYTGGIPSPSPDFPQLIHVVTGNNSVGVQGKNLCKIERGTGTPPKVSHGVSYSYTNNNIISAIGTSDGAGGGESYLFEGTFKAGTYTISGLPNKEVGTDDRGTIYIWYNTIPNTNLTNADQTITGNYSKRTFTITEDAKIGIRIISQGNNANKTYNQEYSIQLEQGSTATSYVPYYHVEYPINLGSLELCKIGDYQDYLYKENGNWYIQKNTKKTILGKPTTGNLVTDYTYNYFTYREEYSGIYPGTDIVCSHFIGAYNLNDLRTKSQYNNSIFWGSGSTFVRVDKFNTVEEYINALSANDITIIGRARTPTTTQITDETLIVQLDEIYEHLQLVKGTNHITITPSDLAPYMELSYMQDLPSKLDNLDSRLSLLE